MSGPGGDRRAARAARFVPWAAAALAALVYLNALANGFAYDDVWIVQTRELVHGFGRLPDLLSADYWPTPVGSGLYRPLTLLSFAVDWAVWGGRPFGFHLVNLLLHAAATALVAVLLLRMFPAWAAAAGAAVFAVHPVHTEAVANVVGRAELLAALFVLAACVVYVDGFRRGRRMGGGRIAALSALYALALLSKEVAVVLPALLLVTDLAGGARHEGRGLAAYARTRAPVMAALAAVLVADFGLRWAVLGAPVQNVAGTTFVVDSSFATRLFTMARVWPRYFELLFLPTDLSADYSPPVILPVGRPSPLAALGAGLLVAIGLLAVAAYRRGRPEPGAAALWAAAALLPVSNLVVVSEIVLAERTFYLPSVAVSMAAATALVAARPRARRWVWAALALWCVAFSAVTVRRNPVWRSTDAVFADLARRHPESSRLLWWLGDRYLRAGDWPAAREWYRRSLEVWPYNPQYVLEFAGQLERRGELEEAERFAARAVDMVPDRPGNHSFLALIRLRRGDPEGALAAADRGLAVTGPDAVLYALRADALAAMGRYAEAAEAQAASVRLRGPAAAWQDWYELARLRAFAGERSGALAAVDSMRARPGADPALADSLAAALARPR